ncbi:MAG: 2'-deoxycytidine 5'-triphosphate deaminase, partial [Hellea sp.]|nr:2'-deoxycytidine 5'-triphosphate deaminase [Hellea sp.]
MNEGISPKQVIEKLIESGHIACPNVDLDGRSTQLQPASLDLSLGYTAYRIRASFLPGKNRTVKQCLSDVKMHEIDLSSGAVLETGCVYLVPLQEALNLPDYLSARANPKSSTGRLDVFTRGICDSANSFDVIPNAYQGPLYVEIAPRTFSILVKPGDRLVQMRFRKGIAKTIRTQTVSIDLQGFNSNIVG